MYDITVRIVEGDFDISVEKRTDRPKEPPSVNFEKGINCFVEVDFCSQASGYLRPEICRYTAFVDETDLPSVVNKIKQSYRDELLCLLKKTETLDEAILKKVSKAR